MVEQRDGQRSGEVVASFGPVDARIDDAVCHRRDVLRVETQVVEPSAARVGEAIAVIVHRDHRAFDQQVVQMHAETTREMAVAGACVAHRLHRLARPQRASRCDRVAPVTDDRERFERMRDVAVGQLEVAVTTLRADDDERRVEQLREVRAGRLRGDVGGAGDLARGAQRAVEQRGEHAGARRVADHRGDASEARFGRGGHRTILDRCGEECGEACTGSGANASPCDEVRARSRGGRDGRPSYNRPVTDLSHFHNRLVKNARHLRKWARRGDIHAYRVYDRDVPEFPVIIDCFDADATTHGDASGIFLHLQEVDTGWQQTDDAHREWIDHLAEVAAATFEIAPDRVALKHRARQRVGGDKTAQHEATGVDADDVVVREGGHRFIVDLHGYLDTGLFLDHRVTRGLVGGLAAGKRFLNLFSYTGSFTVYAAGGGAVSSESVDLSNTYSQWAVRNLRANAIDVERHRVIRADVFTWLRDAVAAFEAGDRDAVDLIVLDPPTFSNSKAMQGVLDVQRDHVWLIRQCLALLSPHGDLFFSTNLRSFELDPLVQEKARFVEISGKTVPEDFRDRRIHRCWHVRHAERTR